LVTDFSSFDGGVPKVDYAEVREQGDTTAGVITKIVKQSNVKLNGKYPYIVSYRYSTNGGVSESKFKTLDAHKIDRMNVGDSVQIKYLNDQSIIASLKPADFSMEMFTFFPLIFAFVGLPCLVYLYYFTRSLLYLYKYGTIAKAQVISMTHKINPMIPRTSQLEVHYQYKSDQDETLLGSTMSSDMTLLNTLKQGEIVKIFVSPYDSSKSTLVPRLEAVRNGWVVD
jgi:hypothetical protein